MSDERYSFRTDAAMTVALGIASLCLMLVGYRAFGADIRGPAAPAPLAWPGILDGKRAAVDERSDRPTAACPADCDCLGDCGRPGCVCVSRARKATVCPPGRLADQDVAIERSQRTGRPVFFWVGMSPADAPRFAAGLDAADPIHCCLSENNGDATPRVIMLTPHAARGVTWKAAELDATAAAKCVSIASRPAVRAATPASIYSPGPTFAVPQYYTAPGYGAGGNCPGGVCPPGRP